jgi:hypothetical protein
MFRRIMLAGCVFGRFMGFVRRRLVLMLGMLVFLLHNLSPLMRI